MNAQGVTSVIGVFFRIGCEPNPALDRVVGSVLADGGGVSRAAVARFHKVIARFPYYYGYPNNNRPVLPLNGRVIELRRSRKND